MTQWGPKEPMPQNPGQLLSDWPIISTVTHTQGFGQTIDGPQRWIEASIIEIFTIE